MSRVNDSYQNPRIDDSAECNGSCGSVSISISKSLWVVSMFVFSIVGGLLTFTLEVFSVFVISTAFILCFGHSLGMHRLLIHRSFECPKMLEYFLVHLGVVVGLAGPKGMMYTHDMRDWAQRQSACHDYYSHRQFAIKDAYWQLMCDIELDNPPEFNAESQFSDDKIYKWMEKYWMWQQLPWTILLFFLGGISWVIWGICVRISISIVGHWLIGYLAHNKGKRQWHVNGAAVQGFNIKFVSLITMGESWHNNHHAYPGSALLGLNKGQLDPGWWGLLMLKQFGLVWGIKLPQDLPVRNELQEIKDH